MVSCSKGILIEKNFSEFFLFYCIKNVTERGNDLFLYGSKFIMNVGLKIQKIKYFLDKR